MLIALKCCPSVCGGEERGAERSRAGDKENERDGQVPGGRIFSSVAQLQSGKWKTSCQCLLHSHFSLQCCFNAEKNKDYHTRFFSQKDTEIIVNNMTAASGEKLPSFEIQANFQNSSCKTARRPFVEYFQPQNLQNWFISFRKKFISKLLY